MDANAVELGGETAVGMIEVDFDAFFVAGEDPAKMGQQGVAEPGLGITDQGIAEDFQARDAKNGGGRAVDLADDQILIDDQVTDGGQIEEGFVVGLNGLRIAGRLLVGRRLNRREIGTTRQNLDGGGRLPLHDGYTR